MKAKAGQTMTCHMPWRRNVVICIVSGLCVGATGGVIERVVPGRAVHACCVHCVRLFVGLTCWCGVSLSCKKGYVHRDK